MNEINEIKNWKIEKIIDEYILEWNPSIDIIKGRIFKVLSILDDDDKMAKLEELWEVVSYEARELHNHEQESRKKIFRRFKIT